MSGIELVFYKDIQDEKLKLPESSELLFENAYEKAAAAAQQTEMYTLGDDSGVFIKALCYFPGVHSRRWTGDEADDKIRNMKIVGYMKDETDRTAELISCFSLVDPDGKEILKTKVVNEFIVADKLNGDKGFGYDSILIPKPTNVAAAFSVGKLDWDRTCEIISNKLTIAELTQREKNVINYRGRIAKPISDLLNGDVYL